MIRGGPATQNTTASGVTIKGVDRLERTLAAFGPRVAKKLKRKAIRRAARILLDETKAQAPVDSGELEESLRLRAMAQFGRRRRKGVVGVSVQTSDKLFAGDQFYAGFQELGTVNMEPNAFLRPASDAVRDQVAQRFRHEARKAIAETARME